MRLIEAAARLNSNPLFVLSTANQELFHSNLLYWLARDHHRDAALPVFAALGLKTMDNGQQSSRIVKREWRNLDLFYDGGLGSWRLALENKILAVPSASQLSSYYDDLVIQPGFDWNASSFTLLSLIPPLDVPEPWRWVDYGDLLQPLATAADALAGFERDLVSNYADMVAGLVLLRDAAVGLRAEDRWHLTSEERSALEEARMWAMTQKMLMTLLAQDVRLLLDQADTPFEVGLTRGVGLFGFHGAPNDVGDRRGWQLQGRQFRRFVTVGPKNLQGPRNRSAREEYVAQRHADHFAFPQTGLDRPRARKEWLAYDPDFVYRYRTVPDSARWGDVVDLCCQATLQIQGSSPDERK